MAINCTSSNPDVSSWSTHELRLAFFDFSVRGEGHGATVAAVIEHWRNLGCLSDADARLWLDALEWRGEGRFLPGWTLPAGFVPEGGSPTDADYEAFVLWRTAARPAAVATSSARFI